jgi:hypothetical protein
LVNIYYTLSLPWTLCLGLGPLSLFVVVIIIILFLPGSKSCIDFNVNHSLY